MKDKPDKQRARRVVGPEDVVGEGVLDENYTPASAASPDEEVEAGRVEEYREKGRDELKTLAGNWSERAEAFRADDAGEAVVQSGLWSDAWQRFSKNRLAVLSVGVLCLFVLLSVFVPMFFDRLDLTTRVDFSKKYQGPSLDHPFGTDKFGRDQWGRAWLAGRVSLAIGFAVAMVILIVGVSYGAVAGYVGGILDTIMMRALDAMYGLPVLPFAIIFIVVVKQKFDNPSPLFYMVPALSIVTWFTAARIIRGQVLSLKENEYVDAARSSGAASGRIIFRHLVPNTLGVLVIAAFLEVPNAILGEAILSFLGLGVSVEDGTSWGQMANESYQDFRGHPHLIAVPSTLIALTVMSSIFIADGLRDALDPRTRKK